MGEDGKTAKGVAVVANGHADESQETQKQDKQGSIDDVKTKLTTPRPGNWGNLNDAQRDALQAFTQQVEDRFGKADGSSWFDETTILRFLRARKFNVERAMEQFSATDTWRTEENVDSIYKTATADELRESRRHYPRLLGRRDKAGRLVFVYRPGSLDAKRQKEIFSVDEHRQLQRIINLTETCTRMWCPLATWQLNKEHPLTTTENEDEQATLDEKRKRIVSEVTSIIDLDQASLGMLWKLRSHLGRASTLASAHYPETLGTMAIVNVPSFFSTIWSWVQKWFDEGTRKKMFIVTAQQLREGRLLDLMHKQDLPKVYGGELEWVYEDEPNVEHGILEAFGSKTRDVPVGPGEWRSDGRFILYDAEERKQFSDALAP